MNDMISFLTLVGCVIFGMVAILAMCAIAVAFVLRVALIFKPWFMYYFGALFYDAVLNDAEIRAVEEEVYGETAKDIENREEADRKEIDEL